jgi:protein translocase SecG subunit
MSHILTDISSIVFLFVGLLLIFVILLQRGRGGGLAGAFGGAGGQSAFGTKAGDVFTRITIGIAVVWVLMAVLTGYAMTYESGKSRFESKVTESKDGGAEGAVEATGATKDNAFEAGSQDENNDDSAEIVCPWQRQRLIGDQDKARFPAADDEVNRDRGTTQGTRDLMMGKRPHPCWRRTFPRHPLIEVCGLSTRQSESIRPCC